MLASPIALVIDPLDSAPSCDTLALSPLLVVGTHGFENDEPDQCEIHSPRPRASVQASVGARSTRATAKAAPGNRAVFQFFVRCTGKDVCTTFKRAATQGIPTDEEKSYGT